MIINMSREVVCISYHFTICFALLILLQSTIAIPIFYSRKLTLRPDEFLLTYIPQEGLLSRESWSDVFENTHNDHIPYLPFRRLTRNTGSGDEARYQIRHVGDLPMFRFG
uniref:Bm391 n=2 Tax=Brugia malayi TaxID=6279 RepID=A0A0I9N4I0_BRUMA|nr:Bm391 [Brugia malayi]